MTAYANHWGGYGSKWQKLEVACAQQGVVLEGAHRALADARATYELLRKIADVGAVPNHVVRTSVVRHRGIELIDEQKGQMKL